MITRDFWRGKKVLVTGHTGFKGSWLCLFLHSLGAKIYGYALPPAESPCLFDVAGIRNITASYFADVTDGDTVQKIFSETSPEIVLHLAAQAIVKLSYTSPVQTCSTNIMGTVNVLQAALESTSVRSVVIVTSDKVYKESGNVQKFSETNELGGRDPYSSSKASAELIADAYRHSYLEDSLGPSKGLATARSGNVIGGGDWSKHRIIPDLVRAAVHDQSLILRYAEAVRPWQHVFDTITGYLLLAQRLYEAGPEYSGPWNFGPLESATYSVEQLVRMFSYQWGESVDWVANHGGTPLHEADRLELDCSKSELRLGHVPLYSIPEAMRETVSWYKAYYAHGAMQEISLEQIGRHLQAVNARRQSKAS